MASRHKTTTDQNEWWRKALEEKEPHADWALQPHLTPKQKMSLDTANRYLHLGVLFETRDHAPTELFLYSPDDESKPLDLWIWRIVLKFIPNWAAAGVAGALEDSSLIMSEEIRFRLSLALKAADGLEEKKNSRVPARDIAWLFALYIHDSMQIPIKPNQFDSLAKIELENLDHHVGADTLARIWKDREKILINFGLAPETISSFSLIIMPEIFLKQIRR